MAVTKVLHGQAKLAALLKSSNCSLFRNPSDVLRDGGKPLQAIIDATKEVKGHAKTYAITGSLPDPEIELIWKPRRGYVSFPRI